MTDTTTTLHTKALARYLEPILPGTPDRLQVEVLSVDGTSNEMYRLRRGEHTWALRLPPPVANAPSAHPVMREATVLRALQGSDVPHPHVVAACDDLTIVGRPFLVMEFVDGFAPRDPLPSAYASQEQRRALAFELVDTLVTIRKVDWTQQGLQDYGRPQNFLERQVQRWMGQLDGYRTRDIEGLDTLARWLEDNRPRTWTAGLMHGDYSFFNVLMSKQPPATMLAVVDWESSTIGDPLMDLGWLVGHWRHADEAPLLDASVTHLDGMPRRHELLERYAMRAPLDAATVPYYAALALFKMACILEGSYARYTTGRSSHPQHAVFEHTVPRLIAVAVDFVTGARPL